VGSRGWPASETKVERRLGTDAKAIEERVAKGDATRPLRIAVVGDIQNGISELGDVLDAHRAAGVDFILQLGDAANVGLPGRYAVLRRMFEEHAAGIPVIAVPGNHDIEPVGTTAVWSEWVGPPQWRLDVRGWRILGLDDSNGILSPASMKLLAEAAKDPAPACGTILVAHRPLFAPKESEARETVEARARQVASTGLVATMTFSGHWHENNTCPDDKGTVHYLLGENCDRSSSGNNPEVSKALLTLQPPGAARPGHSLAVDRIPRNIRFSDEFLRTAVGSTYPWIRDHAGIAGSAVAVALAGALLAFRSALRGGAVTAE
jgi:hypothetical protein